MQEGNWQQPSSNLLHVRIAWVLEPKTHMILSSALNVKDKAEHPNECMLVAGTTTWSQKPANAVREKATLSVGSVQLVMATESFQEASNSKYQYLLEHSLKKISGITTWEIKWKKGLHLIFSFVSSKHHMDNIKGKATP
jgi:hypothetical protein